jgi:hypothetical protein
VAFEYATTGGALFNLVFGASKKGGLLSFFNDDIDCFAVRIVDAFGITVSLCCVVKGLRQPGRFGT